MFSSLPCFCAFTDPSLLVVHFYRTVSPLVRYRSSSKIKKYGSYFLSMDLAGFKWHPVLKVWEQLQGKHSKVTQNFYKRKPLTILFLCKIYFQSSINYPHSRENSIQKFWFCSSFFFFLSYLFSLQHNSKLHGIYKQSTHQTTTLLSEIFLFLVRAVCKLRSMSYGSKYA